MNKLKTHQQKQAELADAITAGATSKVPGSKPSHEEQFHPTGMPGWSRSGLAAGLEAATLIDATALVGRLAAEQGIS